VSRTPLGERAGSVTRMNPPVRQGGPELRSEERLVSPLSLSLDLFFDVEDYLSHLRG